jgi:hypothetical protein
VKERGAAMSSVSKPTSGNQGQGSTVMDMDDMPMPMPMGFGDLGMFFNMGQPGLDGGISGPYIADQSMFATNLGQMNWGSMLWGSGVNGNW